jgi:hypothetical protein
MGRSWPLRGVRQLVTGARPLSSGSGTDRVRKLRPWSRSDTSISNTWQIVVGAILTPLGLLFILLGWYGAAHASYVQQQIPYLVSGGFIGLGCLLLGGLLYWAHWLYRIYDQADLHHGEWMQQSERQHQEQLRVLEQAFTAVAGEPVSSVRSAGNGSAGHPTSTSTSTPTSGDGLPTSGYLATASGTVYHDSNCPVVAHHGRGARALTATDVTGMKACRICLPNETAT